MASQIINSNQHKLPDLSQIVILMPELTAAHTVRLAIMEQAQSLGHQAILGPYFYTIEQWVSMHTRLQTTRIGKYHRQLLLYRELATFPQLSGQGNLWTLSNELLDFFDEMTLNNAGLPDDIDDFIEHLSKIYRIDSQLDLPIGHEARLVHRLWQAWNEQLISDKLSDYATDYALRLAQDSRQGLPENKVIFVAGYSCFNRAETEWLRNKIDNSSVSVFLSGTASTTTNARSHPGSLLNETIQQLGIETDKPAERKESESAFSQCLNQIYNDTSLSIKDRANAFRKKHPQSPLTGRLTVYTAPSSEHEASVIDVQVRKWLLDGKNNIGIITENRRLARRVRALLERSDISITDYSGWALSTSSAASVLERWLQCIEEDFSHEPLLDALRSPYIFPDWPVHDRLHAVYRLENDIILNEQIPRDISRFRKHVALRQLKLDAEQKNYYNNVLELLDRLETAALPLCGFLKNKKCSAISIIDGLLKSMTLLGLDETFNGDAAGLRVLDELSDMRLAAQQFDTELDWLGFRAWLGQNMENSNFRPSLEKSPVMLANLENSPLMSFDALIISSLDKEFVPGPAKTTCFFNNEVRHDLGLPSSLHKQTRLYAHFRRLLEAAPLVLLTHRQYDQGEDIICSPWLELLNAFHKLAYNTELVDAQLDALVSDQRTRITTCDDDTLPSIVKQPAISVPQTLMPEKISASKHQLLLDCPYQYFIKQCLALAPTEEIKLAMQKSDYGTRVHECLQAFHGGKKGMPGPFVKKLTEQTRQEAIEILEEISSQVFAADLEDNFQHRGWLKKWTNIIPQYIDWQIKHTSHRQIHSVEVNHTMEHFFNEIGLNGIIDRIDTDSEGLSIIDYKTGFIPTKKQVEQGEDVQLPFYALLCENHLNVNIKQVEYMALTDSKVGSTNCISGEKLDQLKHDTSERLQTMLGQIHSGTALTAWGDKQTCERCNMQGICRKAVWEKDWEKQLETTYSEKNC